MMVRVLARAGITVNRKRVQRLMNLMGIRSLAPQRTTTVANKEHVKYPYLLRGLLIDRPNLSQQVGEVGDSLTLGTKGRMASSLDKAGTDQHR